MLILIFKNLCLAFDSFYNGYSHYKKESNQFLPENFKSYSENNYKSNFNFLNDKIFSIVPYDFISKQLGFDKFGFLNFIKYELDEQNAEINDKNEFFIDNKKLCLEKFKNKLISYDHPDQCESFKFFIEKVGFETFKIKSIFKNSDYYKKDLCLSAHKNLDLLMLPCNQTDTQLFFLRNIKDAEEDVEEDFEEEEEPKNYKKIFNGYSRSFKKKIKRRRFRSFRKSSKRKSYGFSFNY